MASVSSLSGVVDDIIVETDSFHPNPTWASAAHYIANKDTNSTASTTAETSSEPALELPVAETKAYVVADSKDSKDELSKRPVDDDAPLKFQALDADEDVDRLQSMTSICMCCFKEGMTRMLLTKIPFFRDVIVMSFSCDECGFSNSELQPASDFGVKACKYELKVNPADMALCRQDLNRQVVKSENATIYVPELQFEIPASTKRGDINTVEGIIANARTNLESGQAQRRTIDADLASKLQVVIDRLKAMSEAREAFTFILDDIGGNSFLENPYAPNPDRRVTRTLYSRNADQNIQLGIKVDSATESTASSTYTDKLRGFVVSPELESRINGMMDISVKGAILPGTCSECHAPCETRMCLTDIPFFKEIVIMCSTCDNCGYKDNEVKPGGATSAKGRKVTLSVKSRDDFKRDVMKSDTAGCSIPELDLELTPGTLGGKYTSLEGLLSDIRDQFKKMNQFAMGDSGVEENKQRMAEFIAKYDAMQSGSVPFTFILDDPAGNAHIGPIDPLAVAGTPDAQLTFEEYERTFDQNEELGLNDIDVDEASYRRGYDDDKETSSSSSSAAATSTSSSSSSSTSSGAPTATPSTSTTTPSATSTESPAASTVSATASST